MKKFLALAALVLGLASCQTEPEGLDVNVGGNQLVNIAVNLPEATRTSSGTGFDLETLEANNLELRYILEIYVEGDTENRIRKEAFTTDSQVVFPIRLIPSRNYRVVAWADIVPEDANRTEGGDYDHYYETSAGLTAVTIVENTEIEWNAMDEKRDAFTAFQTINNFSANTTINLTLYRPFAKIRVVSTDIKDIEDLGFELGTGEVEYGYDMNRKFNAYYGTSSDASYKVHALAYPTPYAASNDAYETATQRTLYADYIFVDNIENPDVVQFSLTVNDKSGNRIKTTAFNTDIPVHANKLTTLIGEVLTEGGHVKITVDNDLQEAERVTVISSASHLLQAVNAGGEYILGNNIVVTEDDKNEIISLATRANEPKTTTINLNGYTITINNNSQEALVELNDNDTLIFAGEGTIEGGKLVEGGTVVVTGSAEVEDTVADVKTGIEALKYILANGGEFTMTENLEATDVLEASATKPVILNGNNKTISTSANRIVRITNSNANVTINDVNFVSSAVMVYPSDVRGVAIDPNLSNIALTLNNCTIDFTDETTNDWTYAVNIAGNGTGHKVTVNGGTYEGANVINAHGAKNTIVVKNATLTSLYPNSDVYYGACIWVLQNQESSVYAEGNTFNGNNALAFNLGTGTALEEKNNTDNTKYVAAKVGGAYYYNIAEAINAAEDGETVKVLHSHDCNVGATVATGNTLTLDLNGKTVEGTDTITGSFGLITNKGNLTVKNGTITLKAENNRGWNAYSSVISNTVGGNLVVENVTIEHLGGTDMAYGIDNLTNGKGTSAIANINDGAVVKSCYRAIRQFLNGIEATNELYVNPGAVVEGANKSIWMQDPSKNANTGKLVVNEDATLKGNAYLTVTEGSTEWPVEVSIATSSLAEGSEVMWNANVPAGYDVVEKNGIWTVIGYTEVSTADELVAALEAQKNVLFMNDIKIDPANMSNAYGTTGINVKNGQAIDGNGHILDIKGAGGTWDSGINTTGGLIKNLTVTGSFRGIFINHNSKYSEPVVLENVTIEGTTYTISCDQGLYQGIEATNCTFNGWTSFAKTAGEAKFVNCSFGEGSGYKYCRPYSDTEFVECTFCPGYTVDTTRADVTFTDCTFEE